MPADRRRIRRFAKYAGLTLCLVILAVWITSWWRVVHLWQGLPQKEFTPSGMLRWFGPARYCLVEKGAFTYIREPRRSVWDGTPELGTDGRLARRVSVVVPLWMPLLFLSTATTVLFYYERRAPRGHCPKCRYDLVGNITGVCPECGHVAANNQA